MKNVVNTLSILLLWTSLSFGRVANAQDGKPPEGGASAPASSGGAACRNSCKDQCGKQGDQCKKDIDAVEILCKATNSSAYCKQAKDKGCKASQDYCEVMCFVDFGDTPKCDPDTPDPDRPTDTGKSSGDPHLITFDGQYYDFQAAGEFLLVETLDGEVTVQVRQIPITASASINSAIGIRFGAIELSMDGRDGFLDVKRDGSTLSVDALIDGPVDGVLARRSPHDGLILVKPGVMSIRFDWRGGSRIDVFVQRLGDQETRGLLGDSDGVLENDVVPPEGVYVREWLNTEYADRWRVGVGESLLPYRDAENASTFVKDNHPESYALPSDKELMSAARICSASEVPEVMMGMCIFDVAMTGDASFADGRVDIGRRDVSFTLGGETVPAAIIMNRFEAGDFDAGKSDGDGLWADYDARWTAENWERIFPSACANSPELTPENCTCLARTLADRERDDPADRRAVVAYLIVTPEVDGNSSALDALRDRLRTVEQGLGAAEENARIIDDYRLYRAVSEACK